MELLLKHLGTKTNVNPKEKQTASGKAELTKAWFPMDPLPTIGQAPKPASMKNLRSNKVRVHPKTLHSVPSNYLSVFIKYVGMCYLWDFCAL